MAAFSSRRAFPGKMEGLASLLVLAGGHSMWTTSTQQLSSSNCESWDSNTKNLLARQKLKSFII